MLNIMIPQIIHGHTTTRVELVYLELPDELALDVEHHDPPDYPRPYHYTCRACLSRAS